MPLLAHGIIPRTPLQFDERKEAMTHRMILVSHDFKEVKAMVVAKPKDDAGIAQVAEHAPRKGEDGTSSVSACSNSEVERWNMIFEKLDGA